MASEMITDKDLMASERVFMQTFNGMSNRVHTVAMEHGFWEGVNAKDVNVIGNKLMLVVSELAEAQEVVRKSEDFLAARCPKPIDIGAMEEEFADVFIRLMDTGRKLGLDLGRAIVLKNKYNTNRPYMHGKTC